MLMTRRFAALGGVLSAVVLAWGCVSDRGYSEDTGRTDFGSGSFALESSDRLPVFHFGEALILRSAANDLRSNSKYRYEVQAVNPGEMTTIAAGDLQTDDDGSIPPTAIAHDLGDLPGATEQDGDDLHVSIWPYDDPADRHDAIVQLRRVPNLMGGYNIHEVDPPHVFATNAAGDPSNAFAVSDDGATDPGEVPGPVYVGGETLPEQPAGGTADVYIVRDRDVWKNAAIPQAGDPDHIVGPIAVLFDESGELARTALWTPTVDDVGIYDIVVDVDRNGRYDWGTSAKDGSDGEDKVGLTIQYSQAWMRARGQRHIIMNLAFDSSGRDGQWANEYGVNQDLYMYTNPDVTSRQDLNHKFVTKWIVGHADFDTFWNDRSREDADGCVPFGELTQVLGNFGGATQGGCTNSPPVFVARNLVLGEYDVVMTYDGMNAQPRYCPGRDILDIVSVDTLERLVTYEEFSSLPVEQRRGLTVE